MAEWACPVCGRIFVTLARGGVVVCTCRYPDCTVMILVEDTAPLKVVMRGD